MKYLIMSIFLVGCSCQSAKQKILNYQYEVIKTETKVCKKSYLFLSKCETMTQTKNGSVESGQNLKVSGK